MTAPTRFLAPALAVCLAFTAIAQDSETPEASGNEDPYAAEPYWYHPGHPSNPADAASIKTLPGFQAERVVDVPPEMGSWTALCAAPGGRLIAAAQHKPGLFRITPAAPDDPSSRTRVEELTGVAKTIGWSQGLLHAFDSLYVTVAEENPDRPTGLYRLTDTDGDDEYDDIELLFELVGSGEHGPHNLVVAPDGKGLYLMCGNGTQVPDTSSTLPVATEGVDRLLPPGFNSGRHSYAGFVLRFKPDGSERQLVAAGLRNSYDLAVDAHGELFTFDSDMEWDLGAPWYRPTRIQHIVSGSEFGWREDGANWPAHFEDSSAPVLDVGPGSPTGMVFGYNAAFPERYRNALFVCDWTFATIHAVHLSPEGASYTGSFEEFLGGNGLPVTDVVIADDGAMYFTVGGRRLGAAIYRVRYVGDDTVEPLQAKARRSELVALRRHIESFHAKPSPANLDTIWRLLGHSDRAIRYAARVALEKLPPELWSERAFAEPKLDLQLSALLALARQSGAEQLDRILETCAGVDLSQLSPEKQLRVLRICELALGRLHGEDGAERPKLRASLRAAFPSADKQANRELSRLLAYLGDQTIIDPALKVMRQDTGKLSGQGLAYYSRNPKYGKAIRDMLEAAPMMERMHYARMLLWIQEGWSEEQRLAYFRLIADAVATSKGGHWYLDFWNQIREVALAQLDEETRHMVESSVATKQLEEQELDLPEPIGPGQNWTVDSALAAFTGSQEPRDPEAGKRAYAAASCITCHRLGSDGGSIGPDLSALGQRFTPKDILDATINPDKAVSDQYRMTVLTTDTGDAYSGRIVSRDQERVRIATNLLRPSQTEAVETARIVTEEPLPVSTMPSGLLNPLNEEELLDLLAYLISAGNPEHPLYQHEQAKKE